MGFLDNVFKAVNKVKEIAEEIQDKANESAGVNSESKKEASASRPQMGNCTISKPMGIASRTCECDFYDDQNKTKKVFEIDKRFHAFDSGAGEIYCSYVYTPDITDDDEWAEWESGTPYLMIGFEQFQYNVLKAYNEGKILPDNGTISEVTGSRYIRYKTTIRRGNDIMVAYHFKKGDDEKLLYHFEVCYPISFIGKPMEKVMLDALDLMATTYEEVPNV